MNVGEDESEKFSDDWQEAGPRPDVVELEGADGVVTGIMSHTFAQILRRRRNHSWTTVVESAAHHYLSAHPSHVKRALLKNTFRTAANVCTGKGHTVESPSLERKIAISTGYDTVHRDVKFSRSFSGSVPPMKVQNVVMYVNRPTDLSLACVSSTLT
ncbi:hypothetical protein KIN20_007945 [Parelaphostrongylus tenuis]|uniref:Helix-turn-helix domain-containing protein n=1 Tax=Parelaphostrongylus tenuis TaxID=148309 RepID=A0AAD5M421_PARTN|nr:hypothetical protein KIN20_007945 [Parelaphostrongylus tenuis]